MTKLRKFFASSVMIMTVVVMSGLTAPMATNAAASAGDLIKKDGLSAVYYLGEDGKRYVFPNEATYKSWYSDFSGVVTISSDELASYPLGSNVVVRPGTKLVKITTDPKVYAVEANGTLRPIASEADAIALYGTAWAKRVIDVADSFFTNYTIGTVLASNEVPAGTLVKKADEGKIYYFDGTNYRLIEDEVAFKANRFEFANVLTVGAVTAGGSTITGSEAAIIKTSQKGGTGTVVTGSGLTASLNSMTPESKNIPSGSSVEFFKINLTAANDGAINVSSIKLTAYGLSDSTYIDDVIFYDNGIKVGSSRDINTDGVAIFNFSTPVSVNAGATKTLTVKATILKTKTGSFGLGIASASDIISSGATISGSFPIKGNLMSAVESTVGSIVLVGTDNDVNASFGDDNVLLADFTLAVSDEDALVQTISLYNGGTNSNDIVSNLKLYVDGNEVAQGTYANRYATFNLNNYLVEKSDTVSIEVKGDIGVTSKNDTINLYVKDASDVQAIGKNHGFGLTVTKTLFDSADANNIEVTLVSGDFSIDMDKSTTGTPAKDIKSGDKNVDLATLTLKSNSEDATVNDLILDLAITGTSTTNFLLENVRLVEVSGGTYDLALATTSASASTLTLDDEISLTNGVAKTFKVKADVLNDIKEGVTFKVSLNSLTSGRLNIEGLVSGAAITEIIPSSVSGSVITIKPASLDVNTIALNSGTFVGGASNIEVYKAKFKAGTADGVKIQSLKLTSAVVSGTANAFMNNNITKLDLYVDNSLVKSVSNNISGGAATTTTFSSLNYSIAAGKEVEVLVKATFASTVTAGDFKLNVAAIGDVTVRSLDGAKTVTPTVNTAKYSRDITLATVGSLKVEMLKGTSIVKSSYLLAGSSIEAGRYLGELKFTATNEPIKVKNLVLKQGGDATDADLESVSLVKEDGTVVAVTSVDSTGKATFEDDIIFEAKATSLFITAKAKGINVIGDTGSTATQGSTTKFTMLSISASGNNSGTTLASSTTVSAGTYNIDTATVTETATIVGSKLNSIVNAMVDGKLTGGTKTIAEYKFVFENGENRGSGDKEFKADLTTLRLTITTSTDLTLDNVQAYVQTNSGTKTATTSVSAGVATINLANLEDVDGEITLVVTATVGGTIKDGYLETSIANSGSDFKYNTNYSGAYIFRTDIIGANLSY